MAAFLVLILPLGLAARIAPDSYDAAQVRSRSAAMTVPGKGQVIAGTGLPTQFLATTTQGRVRAEVLDFRYAAQSPELRKDFAGKETEVIGQFLPAETSPAGSSQAALTRMLMICCSADLQPINIPLEMSAAQPQPASLPREMAWVRIVGTVRFDHAERVVADPVLTVHRIEEIPAPKEKYLY